MTIDSGAMIPDEPRPVSPERIGRVQGWTCHHFSISDSEANIPRLLRKTANAIEELGTVEILDVTCCLEVEGPQFEATTTVYLAFPEDEQ
jgi:hypothetical protein